MSDPSFPNPPYTPALSPTYPAPQGHVFPMTFGQILDRIARLMRSHWKTFTAIGLLPMGVLFVFYAFLFGALYLAGVFKHPPAPPNVPLMLEIVLPLGLLFIPVMFLMYGLYYGASTYATLRADHDLNGTAGEALGHAWSRIGRYAWLMLLRSLIIALPIVAVAIFLGVALGLGGLLVGLSRNGGNASAAALFLLIPLMILFYIGVAVYAILMSLRLSLAFAACVEEDITAWQAIKRSGKLTHGAKGRIFLVLLIIYAISYAAMIVVYMASFFLFAIGALAFHGNPDWTSPATIAVAVVAGIAVLALMLLWTALLLAAYSTAFAVFYRDQRLRQEGPPPLTAPATAFQ